MLEVAKSLGLTLSKHTRAKGDEVGPRDEHRLASLVLPLVKYEPKMDRKRKKMR